MDVTKLNKTKKKQYKIVFFIELFAPGNNKI